MKLHPLIDNHILAQPGDSYMVPERMLTCEACREKTNRQLIPADLVPRHDMNHEEVEPIQMSVCEMCYHDLYDDRHKTYIRV